MVGNLLPFVGELSAADDGNSDDDFTTEHALHNIMRHNVTQNILRFAKHSIADIALYK